MTDRTPEYLRVAAHLRREISSGRYAEGDRLPTLREVSAQHGVAYATAAKAYENLREAGIIDSRPGAGTVVRSRDIANEPDLETLRAELRDLAARVDRLEAHADQSTEHNPAKP